MKIFVIGFNKTGTTSIHHLFTKAGINSKHGTEDVLIHIDKYDAFMDGDHYHFHKYYDQYPDSLFILNTRPIKKWLISRYKHALYHKFKDCWCWPVSIERTNEWIKAREQHYRCIWDFFQAKQKQLFIVNIEKQGWESALLDFIGIQNLHVRVHENIRDEKKIDEKIMTRIKNNVDQCLTQHKYSGDEVFLHDLSLNMYQTYL